MTVKKKLNLNKVVDFVFSGNTANIRSSIYGKSWADRIEVCKRCADAEGQIMADRPDFVGVLHKGTWVL